MAEGRYYPLKRSTHQATDRGFSSGRKGANKQGFSNSCARLLYDDRIFVNRIKSITLKQLFIKRMRCVLRTVLQFH